MSGDDGYEFKDGRLVKVGGEPQAGESQDPLPAIPQGDYLDLSPLLDVEPLDEAMNKICLELGLKFRPGGASAYGWSTRSLLLACPYKYKKLYLDRPKDGGPRGRSSTPLETGGLYHQLLAFHYMAMMPGMGGLKGPVEYDWVKRRLLEEKVSGEVVMEGFRLFDAYRFYYEQDYIRPLDVEIEASDGNRNTCRYDAIVEVVPNEALVPPGVYICEHKTARAFDFATLEQWKNDGQIIGQLYIWRQARLKRKYGHLAGVLVNLISKTKTPQFRRIVIAPQAWQLAGHARDLKVWDALENFYRAVGVFPRNRASCRGPYGLCPLHDHCAGGNK